MRSRALKLDPYTYNSLMNAYGVAVRGGVSRQDCGWGGGGGWEGGGRGKGEGKGGRGGRWDNFVVNDYVFAVRRKGPSLCVWVEWWWRGGGRGGVDIDIDIDNDIDIDMLGVDIDIVVELITIILILPSILVLLQGEWSKALSMLDQMRDGGVKINGMAYSGAIKVSGGKRSFYLCVRE